MTLRSLAGQSRGLAAAAVVALALGIGITALMFAIVDGTERRGLPVAGAGEVVHLARVPGPGADTRLVFLLADRAQLEQQGSLSAIAAYGLPQTNLAGDGLTPRRWAAATVTRNTFEILGVGAAHGRASLDVTADGMRPLLISDNVWRAQFGAEPSAVGRMVRANGDPAVIVGVMPPGFRFPYDHHLWMPIDEQVPATPVQLWGRLARGRSAGDAAAELTTRYQQSVPATGARVAVTPFTSFFLGPAAELLDTMFLACIGVLAIACANVANLLLARGLARRRDFAIAGALGASRARLTRERVLEGLALAAPGAVLGVALTYAGAAMFTRALTTSFPAPPYWVAVIVDTRVLAFVVAITLVAALAAAAIPAWRSRSAALSTALSDEARGATSASLRRITAALIVVEIALASGVLVAGGLMAKGIARLTAADFDFAVADVMTGRVTLPPRPYPNAEARRAFLLTLYSRLQTLPGARAAAFGSSLPFMGADAAPFTLDGHDPEPARWPKARPVLISPGYFEALGVSLIGGRDFELADREGRAAVAIVNLSFALKFAPRRELIGETVTVPGGAARPGAPATKPVTATIIGVAPDLFVGNPRAELPEAIYFPVLQQAVPPDGVSVLARGDGGAAGLERPLREAIAGIDPDLPLDRAMTLASFRHGITWFYRVFGGLFLVFALGALILALVGVYAVMSFGVTRRRREIGTRMACGASRGHIARLFLLEGTRRLAIGLALGAILAAFLTPRLSLFLFQVSPRDPAVFAAAIAIVAIVGLSACAIPAIRAARQDPNVCLRDE